MNEAGPTPSSAGFSSLQRSGIYTGPKNKHMSYNRVGFATKHDEPQQIAAMAAVGGFGSALNNYFTKQGGVAGQVNPWPRREYEDTLEIMWKIPLEKAQNAHYAEREIKADMERGLPSVLKQHGYNPQQYNIAKANIQNTQKDENEKIWIAQIEIPKVEDISQLQTVRNVPPYYIGVDRRPEFAQSAGIRQRVARPQQYATGVHTQTYPSNLRPPAHNSPWTN